ncbi:hypothetical protein [Butyrivibrio proteoclasticus]|uniref:hypothetical protein n=1 Tax=Butyrivibrio proteoclasticus TaxID=43305 RepID=UPI00047AF95B|nr:hypothetical protein [Butyrivibrio proteoclasticus]
MNSISRKFLSSFIMFFAVFYLVCGSLLELQVEAKDDPYTELAKATTTYNGVNYSYEYNALFYYLNYEDLRNAYGTDANKLIEHWVVFGKKEGRVANRLIGDNLEYVVPTGDEDVVVIPKTKHDNGGMTYGQEVMARSIAKQIAAGITEAGGDKVKEVEKVAYAAGVVKAYCDLGTYTTEGQIYRTAYGVFIGGEYSCAGATRALGLILDYMGITWVHKNINSWDNQWCQVIVDGKEGYGDAILAQAGYGKHPDEGGSSKNAVSYAKVRKKFDVKTQRKVQ